MSKFLFMLNKICAIACILIFGVSAAQAARSTYNPMVPRQLKIESAQKDYSYGYSILSGNAIDTLEVPNRVVGWTLNYEIFDRYLLRPVAHGYAALPQPVQLGVGNFFSNISELNNTVNNLFIGELKNSGISLTRFIVNSTMGFLGFIDVASQMGLDNKPMEMDTVLGKAGMDSGPFGGKDFLLYASDRQNTAPEGHFACHGYPAPDLPASQRGYHRAHHGDTGGRAVLRYSPFRDMHVDVFL